MKNSLKLLGLLSLCVYSAVGTAASLTVFYGDADGFGFTDTVGLTNSKGAPADTNGNGILEPGEFLPDLNPGNGVNPAGDDIFDNRQGDPTDTDVGVEISDVFSTTLTYSLPSNQPITEAKFSIVIGDASRLNQALHIISLDGYSTGVTINPRGATTDGLITETVVDIDPSLYPELMDGEAVFSISYDLASDDIAIDFAKLSIQTVPIPAPAVLLGSALVGLIGIARKKKET